MMPKSHKIGYLGYLHPRMFIICAVSLHVIYDAGNQGGVGWDKICHGLDKLWGGEWVYIGMFVNE